MTAAPLFIFAAAASAAYVQLLAWGLGPLVAFLLVSAGASGLTLGTLLVVELADGRHTRRRHELHVVRPDERPALDVGALRADVVDIHRTPAAELGPGGDVA